MRAYLSFLKLRLITGLQYRTSAIAGLVTQFFFGIVYVIVYVAFFNSSIDYSSIELSRIVSYVWLNQSLYALTFVYYKDSELITSIKNGNVAYEMCKPKDIYIMWYLKIYAYKFSQFIFRFSPILIFAFLLPEPYNLMFPVSFEALLLFIVTIFISSLLITGYIMISHIISFYTLSDKGITSVLNSFFEMLSGISIPLPLFPQIMQNILKFLPFMYISDFSLRIYTGYIQINEVWSIMLIQLVWTVFIIGLGYLLMKRALKRIVSQGG